MNRYSSMIDKHHKEMDRLSKENCPMCHKSDPNAPEELCFDCIVCPECDRDNLNEAKTKCFDCEGG